MALHGIKIRKSREGLLHKDLGVKEGEKLPAGKLEAAKDSKDPKVRRRAQFAINARKWNKGGSKKSAAGSKLYGSKA